MEELNEQFKFKNEKLGNGEPAISSEHLIRPAATFSPSDAEKESLRALPSTATPRRWTLDAGLQTLLRCPVLLIQGEEDEVFPVSDCKRLAELLRSNGTTVEVRILPESGHGFAEDRRPVVRALAESIARPHFPKISEKRC